MARPVSRLKLDLGTLPPGHHHCRLQAGDVGFDAFVWRGAPGPVVLVNGATHGDEYEGPTLLRRWAHCWRPRGLRGTVVLVPVLNEGAFFAGRRCHPADDGNLARAFPGAARGGPTARLAHLFDTELLAQATHYVDLHSGGSAYQLLPWVGYFSRPGRIGATQRNMAACFDSFWCWAAPFLPGRTLSAAHARNIPAIYVECTGTGGVAARDLAALDRGLDRLLHSLGCFSGKQARSRPQVLKISRDAEAAHLQAHHPAPHDGLFVPAIALGATVRRGELLGHVHSLGPQPATEVRAEHRGRVVLLRHQRSVRKGDALVTLAPA